MRSMDWVSRTGVRLWACVLIGAVSWECAVADQTVRVVSWNVETVGTPGSAQYDSTVDILARIDANLVAISEVASAADADALMDLAFDLGYLYTSIAPAGPFGALRNAILSDYPITWETSWSAADLSDDALANDLTRYLQETVVDITDVGDPLRVVSVHLKSGSANTDEYRRAIEAVRMGQVAQHPIGGNDPIVMMGDLNADTRDDPQTPAVFTSEPSGLPTDFVTGADIRARLAGDGLVNDPFLYLKPHVVILDAEQLDGEVALVPHHFDRASEQGRNRIDT
ncbi:MULTISPECIES: endonuclease/exonuclease/phosphatase family protein [unclassified Thiocapsa]|uniref:endonuclease/exonuclease/phosphatase family protein n=1 Tax=unclassified Thiocapsa TaxID=2641286 RepID=UPI0035ADECF8